MVDIGYNLLVALVMVGIFRRQAIGFDLVARFAVLGVISGIIAAPIAYAAINFSKTDAMFSLMRHASYVGFVHFPVAAAISGVRLWSTDRRWAIGLGLMSVLLVSVAIDAFLIEPTALEIREVELRSEKVTRPITIALVSDLQTDDATPYERRALEIVKMRHPDLILFAGDYVHANSREAYADTTVRINRLLRDVALEAPLGMFAVRGNVEAVPQWPEIFSGTGVTVVDGTKRFEFDELTVTPLALWDSFNVDLTLPESEKFHVVMGHGPDFALSPVKADLLLAGHTHGGQVRIPWFGPIVTLSQIPRDWAAGVTTLSGGRTLIVSRGIGMERGGAPRLRFNCRPELVFVTLKPR